MHRTVKRAAAIAAALAATATVIPMLTASPAAAAGSLQGAATLTVQSGTSATPFSLSLPVGASCTGDSAALGYTVTSYMVPISVDPSTLQFDPITGPNPQAVGASFRQPMYEAGSGNAFTSIQTANAEVPNGPGRVINIGTFDFGSTYGAGDIPAGVYNLGIVCVLGQPSATQMKEYWNTTMTVRTDAAGGPSQIKWKAGVKGAAVDFDGNTKSDVAVFRPSNGIWYINGQAAVGYGANGDVPVRGDYDGDGKTDVAVFRPSNNLWYINGQPAVGYGAAGDIPVPGDYNGDAKTDVAVWRPSNGVFYINGQPAVGYGANGDVPVPADYDGDGDTDVAVYRPSTGVWFILGKAPIGYGGTVGDVPVPADYDGDGDVDVAIYRPSNGIWYVLGQTAVGYGAVGDLPAAADYDGDGDTDVAVFRPSSGIFFINGQAAVGYGTNGDRPVATRPPQLP